MPWKACSVMDERLHFIARLREGESMTELCHEAGISRKTGYKIFNRYKEEGVTAVSDRSRRPVRYANQLPPQLEAIITGLKKDTPHWGARKLRELMLRRLPTKPTHNWDGTISVSYSYRSKAVMAPSTGTP